MAEGLRNIWENVKRRAGTDRAHLDRLYGPVKRQFPHASDELIFQKTYPLLVQRLEGERAFMPPLLRDRSDLVAQAVIVLSHLPFVLATQGKAPLDCFKALATEATFYCGPLNLNLVDSESLGDYFREMKQVAYDMTAAGWIRMKHSQGRDAIYLSSEADRFLA